jgi:5'(3')-deoxyribonucleotidase
MPDPVTVFVDIDGVLADFATEVARLCGQRDRDPWSNDPPRGYDLSAHYGMSTSEMWRRVDRTASFWNFLGVLPWARQLVKEVIDVVGLDNVYLLSAPSLHPSSASGKVAWVTGNFRQLQDRLILAPAHAKPLLASPRSMLIDDRQETCREFDVRGGRSWLFPAPWNRAGAGETYKQIQDRMPAYIAALVEDLRKLCACT